MSRFIASVSKQRGKGKSVTIKPESIKSLIPPVNQNQDIKNIGRTKMKRETKKQKKLFKKYRKPLKGEYFQLSRLNIYNIIPVKMVKLLKNEFYEIK